jgi:hypothetical protein
MNTGVEALAVFLETGALTALAPDPVLGAPRLATVSELGIEGVGIATEDGPYSIFPGLLVGVRVVAN